jgi:hypothetical protein
MPSVDQRWIEQHIREEPERYRATCVQVGGPRILVVQLVPFLLAFACRGRHKVCTTFSVWHTHVVSALMQHGYYDPATNHTPPAARQLDALECREDLRAGFNRLLPGLPFWGEATQEEGEETSDDC